MGGATFACLLMLKHLFLALAPLYFVYLLRSYCCCCESVHGRTDDELGYDSGDRVRVSGGGGGGDGGAKRSQGNLRQETPSPRGHNDPQQASSTSVSRASEHASRHEGERTARIPPRLSWTRLVYLGSIVLCVFGSVLGPLCVSDGLAKDACLKQLGQLGVRLFPFGRRV